MGGIDAETKFAYDAQDNLTKVTDPKGLDTTYPYNGLGDLTQTGQPRYRHHRLHLRQRRQPQDPDRCARQDHDLQLRCPQPADRIAYATRSLNVGYTYDTTQAACTTSETFSTGRLTQMADASGNTQYCYDRFGNLVRKVQTTNGKVFTVRYAYTPGRATEQRDLSGWRHRRLCP